MLAYADVCWRMLTHADVCRRILKHASQADRLYPLGFLDQAALRNALYNSPQVRDYTLTPAWQCRGAHRRLNLLRLCLLRLYSASYRRLNLLRLCLLRLYSASYRRLEFATTP
jgi:hypothetical protein